MGKLTLIKNAKAIVTCDSSDSVFLDSDILIDGPAIVGIGHGLECSPDETIDASGKFIYPGLVNTHHHFFQTFVRNLKTIDYPNMTVPEWLDRIYRIFQRVDSDVIFYSSLTAFADLIKHGCTTAFDHQYCYTSATGKTPVDRQMEAASTTRLSSPSHSTMRLLSACAFFLISSTMVPLSTIFLPSSLTLSMKAIVFPPNFTFFFPPLRV